MVFDKGDVEAGGAAELDIAAGEEVEGGLLEAAFCLLGQRGLSIEMERKWVGRKRWRMIGETYFSERRRGADLLGYANESVSMDVRKGRASMLTLLTG